MTDPAEKQRVDKWLWYARFFKTRTLAASLCKGGKVRLNGDTLVKAQTGVRVGDTLTFAAGPNVRVVRVLDLGTRRGPAPEAQGLYEDLAPPPTPDQARAQRRDQAAFEGAGTREEGSGRPTKRDRRVLDRWQSGDP